MAGKRQATTNLNHDNWDQEEEPEERGVFRQAPEDVLKARNIKKARRMVTGGLNAGGPEDAPTEPKSVFSGFSGFGKSNTKSTAKSSPFSFLDNLSAPKATAEATTSSVAAAKPMFSFSAPANDKPATTSVAADKPTFSFSSPANDKPATNIFGSSSSISTTTDSAKPTTSIFGTISTSSKKVSSEPLSSVSKSSPSSSSSKSESATAAATAVGSSSSSSESSQYNEAVAELNKSILKFLQEELKKSVYCILTPVFDDYALHLKKLKDSPSLPPVAVSSASSPLAKPTATFSLGKPSGGPIGGSTSPFAKAANCTVTSGGTTTTSTTPKFSFGSFGTTSSSVSPSAAAAASPAAPATSIFGFTPKPASEAKTTEEVPKPGGGLFSFLPTEQKSESTLLFGAKRNDSSFSNKKDDSVATPTKTNGFSFGLKSSNDEKPVSSKFAGFGKPADAAGAGAGASTGFSFSSGATPFSFGNIKPPAAAAAQAVADEEEEDKPPKVEFTQVKEDDAIYSKRCKVYIKKDAEYVDRGIGTLYLKPIKDSEKTQLIVRADTNLGNILINLILSDGMPCNRQGKNNVLMVWMPTPEETKATILLRVKTGDEADALLNEIKKHIK